MGPRCFGKWFTGIFFALICKISKVHHQLQETQAKQKSIDQSLEYIEAQQNELDSALESFHSQIKTLVDGPEGQARLKYVYFMINNLG